jgi:signal transduction histidine kinase
VILKRKFLVIIVIFGWLFSSAQSIIEVTEDNNHFSIGKMVGILIDESGELTVDQLIEPAYQSQFIASDGQIINIGVTNSTLWCKLKVSNNTAETCFLELRNMALDSVFIYEKGDEGVTLLSSGGSYLDFDELELKYNTFLYYLTESTNNPKEFYVKVKHTRGTQFSFFIGTAKGFGEWYHKFDFIQGLYFGFMLLMVLYNLFIYFTVKDISYIYYVIYGTAITLLNASLTGYGFEYIWPELAHLNRYQDLLGIILGVSGLVFAMEFLQTKKNAPIAHKVFKGFIGLYFINAIITLSGNWMLSTIIVEVASLLLILSFFATAFYLLRKGYKPAKFFLYAWSILLLGVALFVLKDFNLVPYNVFTIYSLQIGSALEALLLSFALADRINIYKKEKEEAQASMLQSLQENEKLIIGQNQLLETKVTERTSQLNQSLENLKSTQAQLIQSEKMASLGELTAGIAHEIQNPLNFVNNFSEVSVELVDEMNEEIENEDYQEVRAISSDLKQNLHKIAHHGRRAESIVKGMLLHSRSSKGEKIPTDINALCDEFARLSYHGLRAKDRNFNAEFETHFDKSIPKIEVVAQDMGRVILNLINNAFQAFSENQDSDNLQEGNKNGELGNESPKVIITTKNLGDKVEITVQDNGPGIPVDIKDKIFQPFFTTKPTGQGTGLGLSLAYDIIKGHGGSIEVESTIGKGTIFQIRLPIEIST